MTDPEPTQLRLTADEIRRLPPALNVKIVETGLKQHCPIAAADPARCRHAERQTEEIFGRRAEVCLACRDVLFSDNVEKSTERGGN